MTHAIDAITPMNLTNRLNAAETIKNDHASEYSESYFDALYEGNKDPWHYQTRWYEKRKRDICLSLLPQSQYKRAIELGCGNGVFSELLADRCQSLVCIDGNRHAVHLAKQRLVKASYVQVIQGIIPKVLSDLPKSQHGASTNKAHQSTFDLIVISEILYYLSAADIDIVINWVQKHLVSGGTLLCCHWRYAIDGFDMTGEKVHERLQNAFNLPVNERSQKAAKAIFTHQSCLVDRDFLLDVWQNTQISVAEQENLV
ncbi:class I SAM-dependent DNA methyltransferase [Psychrobacter sp. MF31]|uniref:class I SAM-dependent DNA methyltransferase n=1 Tax=Psychrobacter TaxID=497 RepID=UPI0035C19FEC